MIGADDGPDAAGQEPDEGDDDPLAPYVELAMKNRQHGRAHNIEPRQDDDPLYCFGSGDATVYAMEDGRSGLMIGRAVGRDTEGCVFCLVGASRTAMLTMLDDGEVPPTEAFDDARDLSLCSVFEDVGVDNVVLVQHYRRLRDVPAEYLPGQPFLEFTAE